MSSNFQKAYPQQFGSGKNTRGTSINNSPTLRATGDNAFLTSYRSSPIPTSAPLTVQRCVVQRQPVVSNLFAKDASESLSRKCTRHVVVHRGGAVPRE